MFLTPVLAQSSAQSPYVLTSYDITQLASRPGKIVVGTRVQTHIEFEDRIEDVSSARQDWFTIETRQNRVSMRADQPIGRTDLMVIVGGRTVLFTLEIDDTLNVPQRYVVGEVPRPAPQAITTSTRSSQSTAPSPVEPQLHQERAEQVPEGETADLPAWLVFTAEATYAPNGVLAITYALANQGEHPVVNDVLRLRLELIDPIAGAQRLPYTLSRVSTGRPLNRLAPDGVEFGTLLVEDVPKGTLRLTWPVVQIGPAQEFNLRRTFHERFSRELP